MHTIHWKVAQYSVNVSVSLKAELTDAHESIQLTGRLWTVDL